MIGAKARIGTAVGIALLAAGCGGVSGSGGSSGSGIRVASNPDASGGGAVALVRVHFKAANWSSSLLPMTVVVYDHLGQETIVLDPGEAQIRTFLVPGPEVISADVFIGPDFYTSVEFETISDPERCRLVVAGNVTGSGFPPLCGIGIGEWEAQGVWQIERICTLAGCGLAPTALWFPTIPSNEQPNPAAAGA
ncbi:MAG: hypothetical protein JXP34_17140 [Planctomycetes bacterium]|nr:hypothetical protein [Planctomycetota bacterium]